MEPAGRLELALQFRGPDTERREAFLRECLKRPQPERTPLLSLLLTLWAETQPQAAADWILANLEKPESSACLNDVLRTWAAQDAQRLAEWANARSQRIGREIVNNAMTALERHSPLWFARLTAMECNRDTEWSGMRFDILREPGAAKALSPRLAGHVAYSADPARLAKPDSAARDEPQKWGWNRLFERTAVYWHAEDPDACGAWLETFPENARLAARRSIQEAESAAKAEALPPKTEPAPDSGNPSSANAAITAAATATGESPASVPSGELPASAMPAADAPRQIQAWSQWWRRDSKAADAFLQNSAWPDDLKFHARAAAFRSAP